MEFSNSKKIELPQNEIFSLMKTNIYKYHRDKNSININKSYILQRKSLIDLIHKISTRMNYKSRTFYLAVNYLDIIFNKQKDIKYNYNLLAAACLIISSKFCENVPLKPTFKHFINLYNEEINNSELQGTKEDLFLYEIFVCKSLDYKLNYFTIYDFNFFFFGNGILKFEHLKEINNSIKIDNAFKRNILIKIYERSKLYLNNIINNLICMKYNSLLISICIMEKSIDYVLIKEFNREDSFNIDFIKQKNKKYFWEIMKEFYNIECESSQDYQYLKLDCEKYKIFEEKNYNKYNNNTIDLNKSQNLLFSNNFVNKLYKKVNSSKSKSKNKTEKIAKNGAFKTKKFIKQNTNNTFLYKKVNISCYENIKDLNEDKKEHQRKESINNQLVSNKPNSKRTVYEFYQNNNNNHHRNAKSILKNNYYLKKSSTSFSPFKNFVNKNITNIKKIESPDSNSNSFDERKEINDLLINNKNINLKKPYKKKIIYNHEMIPNKNINHKNNNNNTNNNININININNRILYEDITNSNFRNKSSKKIIISKYNKEDNSSNNIKGRNFKYKSKAKINTSKFGLNLGSSPIYKRNISRSKYNISFKKDQIKDKSYNQINLNSFCEKENENNKKINNKVSKLYINNINYNDIQNSSLTSRNSLLFPNHNIKLSDSFVNIQMNYFNNDLDNKNFSTITSKKNKDNKLNFIQNYESLNYNQYNTNDNSKPAITSKSNLSNNNYNNCQNNINNNFNINFNYINENI